MSDRELLELAAKAAGYGFIRWETDEDGVGLAVVNHGYWQPLYMNTSTSCDGDALRLMVRLRLEPRFLDNSHSNGAEPSRVTLHNFAGIVENIDGDPLAATRRAIVRAAAEIGRRLP